MEKLQNRQKLFCMLRVLWNYSEVFLQLKTNWKHIYNIIIRLKLKPLKCFRNSRKSTWFLALSYSDLELSWHSAFARHCTSRNGSRITSMGLQTLLRYVECFLEFKESIGMLLEAFWKLSDAFFEASKKSVLNLEISGNFYFGCFTPWRSFKTAKKLFCMLRVLWNYSEVFLQVKTNRKHIYNIIIRPKLTFVG